MQEVKVELIYENIEKRLKPMIDSSIGLIKRGNHDEMTDRVDLLNNQAEKENNEDSMLEIFAIALVSKAMKDLEKGEK